jgi:crotonobetainyl-CoA:carnitine CoA-transferase CaiB-like acyl-CoA transferase
MIKVREHLFSDLKVVEWGSFVSAAFCTKLMADFGAEVIKVEPPAVGDEARHYGPFPNDIPDGEKSGLFLYLNTNKYGVTLDPSKAAGKKLFQKLIGNADILVHNYPTLFTKRLKLDFNSLKEINPKLIMVSITPYGQTGPYKNWKGYDINCGALGGISTSIGYPDREPLTCPLFQGDYQAGLCGAIATMIALFERDGTDHGVHIDLSEAECWATFHIGVGMQAYISEGRVRRRSGHRSLHRPYPDEVLPCKDGYVCIDTPQNRQWLRFLELMGNPEWAKNSIFENRIKTTDEYGDQADTYLSEWLMKHDKQEIFKLCQDNKVPAAPIKTVDEVANDEHLKERNYFVELNDPHRGKLKIPGFCYKFSLTPSVIEHQAPYLGEHNKKVYCDQLGYSTKELNALKRAEVI